MTYVLGGFGSLSFSNLKGFYFFYLLILMSFQRNRLNIVALWHVYLGVCTHSLFPFYFTMFRGFHSMMLRDKMFNFYMFLAVNISFQFVKCAFEIILLHASLSYTNLIQQIVGTHFSSVLPTFLFMPWKYKTSLFHSRSWYSVTLTRTHFPLPFFELVISTMLYCVTQRLFTFQFSFCFFIYYHIHFC